jgi:hypothetical protein
VRSARRGRLDLGRDHALAMTALPFVLFMFLDQVALMLVLIPIYQPIIRIYQFDESGSGRCSS